MNVKTATTIPLGGVPCGRCGYPAHTLEHTSRGTVVIRHLDRRIRPCQGPKPTGGQA